MAKRKIIKINQDKCNGCGLCIPNCPEGAIQVIDGKARLVSDLFCDGLGACLGHCPQGAITIEEREAEEYSERKEPPPATDKNAACSCPGSKVMDFRKEKVATTEEKAFSKTESRLRQWPVQIKLVPAKAAYFENADLLIAADCVPFAYADFHLDLLKGKILLVGCPKLDDAGLYQEKIAQILKNNSIKSVTYAHMEVPCCFGLTGIIKSAISASGKNIPFKEITISIKGERIE